MGLPRLKIQLELSFMDAIKLEEAEKKAREATLELALVHDLLDAAKAPADWEGVTAVPARIRALAERWLSFSGNPDSRHSGGCQCRLCSGARTVRLVHQGMGQLGSDQWAPKGVISISVKP